MSALSAGDAVLGLLIEEPGNTYQLERRLERRFGSSSFAHGTAYHAFRRLADQGLIRPRATGQPAQPDAASVGSLTAVEYEATASGVEHFERWLQASTSMPPVPWPLPCQLPLQVPGARHLPVPRSLSP